jgi:predicted HAD superfamily Cof-like phosphohydrolase
MTKGLDVIVESVGKFHTAFAHPVADKIKPLELERGTARAIWTGEEALVEFLHQSSDNEEQFLAAYDKALAGLEKAKAKSLAMEYSKTDLDKVIGQSDAIIDAFYFLAGSLVEMGVKPQALFDIVQAANMAKLGPDGKPIIRPEDGKIMKPEGWEPPEAKLEAEIKRQYASESNE